MFTLGPSPFFSFSFLQTWRHSVLLESRTVLWTLYYLLGIEPEPDIPYNLSRLKTSRLTVKTFTVENQQSR